MADNIKRQTYDNGAVIGYRPNLEYTKELNNTAEAIISQKINKNGVLEGTDMFVYSQCLNGFGQNKPSDAMKAIDYAVNNMEMLLDRLTDKFIAERNAGSNPFSSKTGKSSKNSSDPTKNDPSEYNGGTLRPNTSIDDSNTDISAKNDAKWPVYNDPYAFRDALDNNDTPYIREFVDYHSKNINGSIIPELMEYIHGSEDQLKKLKNLIGDSYYNQPRISTEDAKSSDDTALSRMRTAERSGNDKIINYPMIAFDAIFSRSVQMHAYHDNKQAINVANVIVKRDKGVASANDMDVIKKLYEEVNIKLDKRAGSYNKTQTIELMQKALYNYYETRKYLNDLCDLRSEDTSSESVFIGRKTQEYAERTKEALRNVNRVFKLDELHLEEICKLEKEKYFIKGLYGSTSSNI